MNNNLDKTSFVLQLYSVILLMQDYKNNDPLILINSNWLPYLRSMSSMTKEEERELGDFVAAEMFASQDKNSLFQLTRKALFADFFNKRHIDYRGLIPMGLALEATETPLNFFMNESDSSSAFTGASAALGVITVWPVFPASLYESPAEPVCGKELPPQERIT